MLGFRTQVDNAALQKSIGHKLPQWLTGLHLLVVCDCKFDDIKFTVFETEWFQNSDWFESCGEGMAWHVLQWSEESGRSLNRQLCNSDARNRAYVRLRSHWNRHNVKKLRGLHVGISHRLQVRVRKFFRQNWQLGNMASRFKCSLKIIWLDSLPRWLIQRPYQPIK